MVKALAHEIFLRKGEFEHVTVETIYFGGGTPSLLSQQEIDQIILRCQKGDEEAFSELQNFANLQFDQEVVKAFLALRHENNFIEGNRL